MRTITEHQIRLLKECYLQVTLNECKMITGLSIPTIKKYARKLNLGIQRKPVDKAWTREQDSFLINYKDKMTHEELADKLGRTKNAVAIRLHYLLAEQPAANRKRPLLNSIQIAWLKENYPYRLNTYLAKFLEITVDDVKFWADRLELKKWESKTVRQPRNRKKQ